ncbi:MAG: hypothetical protein Q9174_007041 [Haloplaca sp. 1 TL-2023]
MAHTRDVGQSSAMMFNETWQTLFFPTVQTLENREAPDLCWSQTETWPGAEPKTRKVITSILVPCSQTSTLSSSSANKVGDPSESASTPLPTEYRLSKEEEQSNREKWIGAGFGLLAAIIFFAVVTYLYWPFFSKPRQSEENVEMQPINAGQDDDGHGDDGQGDVDQDNYHDDTDNAANNNRSSAEVSNGEAANNGAEGRDTQNTGVQDEGDQDGDGREGENRDTQSDSVQDGGDQDGDGRGGAVQNGAGTNQAAATPWGEEPPAPGGPW